MQDRPEQEAFVTMVQDNRLLLHKVCNVYCTSEPDRQDLYQEITYQLWKAFPTFRGEAKRSTWVYRIALNTAISAFRKQKRRLIPTDPGLLPASMPDLPYPGEREEQLRRLYDAIDQLSDFEKALVMLYLEDKPYEEMEDILGVNQNNLRVKMNRIKDKLRKITKETPYGIGKP